jgi:SAM-dependent methyltransferase
VFIHGGAWRAGRAENYAAPAEMFVHAGAHYVVPDFVAVQDAGGSLFPMADQVRRAIAWVYTNAVSFGGDPQRLYIGGHSSGAHLAAVALTTDWEELFGLPPDMCSSGMYDLVPVRLSHRSSYVRFTDAMVEALSPLRHLDRLQAPLIVSYGTYETPEFQRQARDFAAAVAAAGKPVQLIVGENYSHMELPETLANPYGLLGSAVLDQMGLAGSAGEAEAKPPIAPEAEAPSPPSPGSFAVGNAVGASAYGAEDIPYVNDFTPCVAPAFLDYVALSAGFAAPERQDGFAFCDVGCGRGATVAILAATHPNGRFYGIDLMQTHIEQAAGLAAEAGINNATFLAADITASDLALPQFDYIVAHGVYTWVDPRVRAALLRLIDRRLKPGGLVYLSYNALPGRAVDAPLQHLLKTLGETLPGSRIERLARATAIVRHLAEAGAPAVAASTWAKMMSPRGDADIFYLMHELMVEHWQPLFVTEIRRATAAIGLVPVGSAGLLQNYDALIFDPSAREVLAAVADPDVRELLRDFFLTQSFRRDVFTRHGGRLARGEARERLLSTTLALTKPASAVAYQARTPAGVLEFDDAATRRIVAALARGPQVLRDIGVPQGASESDLLSSTVVLCGSEAARPVEGGDAPVEAINRAISRRFGTSDGIGVVVLPCGTALHPDPSDPGRPAEPGNFSGAITAAWRELLAAYGA